MNRTFLFTRMHSSAGLARGAALFFAGMLLTGCPAPNQPAAMLAVTPGKIIIRGSNTIGEELAPRLITEFKKDQPTINFEVETKATGYGLAALRAGQCDIAAASRPATPEEVQEAGNLHVELIDHPIGSYAVAVIVHGNNGVANLTREQVRDIFTGTVQNWKDVGGADAPIHLYVRDPISGTYLGFKELAMENKAYAAGPKLVASYLEIAQDVAQDEGGIGYVGIELPKGISVKAVTIGGVMPTAASVRDGKYPYARPLHLYTRKGRDNASANDFVQFVLAPKGQQVMTEMGFVPHP